MSYENIKLFGDLIGGFFIWIVSWGKCWGLGDFGVLWYVNLYRMMKFIEVGLGCFWNLCNIGRFLSWLGYFFNYLFG